MAGVMDVMVVSVVILAAAIYALTSLAPRPVRRRTLGALAALARRVPGGTALGARLAHAAEAAQPGCGGCDGCGSASPHSTPANSTRAGRAPDGLMQTGPGAAGSAHSAEKPDEVRVPLSLVRRRR